MVYSSYSTIIRVQGSCIGTASVCGTHQIVNETIVLTTNMHSNSRLLLNHEFGKIFAKRQIDRMQRIYLLQMFCFDAQQLVFDCLNFYCRE